MEQMEEKANAGDARAQTRVSESTCPQTGTWHCFQSCWWTQSGCEHVSIFGRLEDDPFSMIHQDIVTHTNHYEHYYCVFQHCTEFLQIIMKYSHSLYSSVSTNTYTCKKRGAGRGKGGAGGGR